MRPDSVPLAAPPASAGTPRTARVTPPAAALTACAAAARLVADGHVAEGLAEGARAVALAPDDPIVATLHGVLLHTVGRLPEAITELQRATALPGAQADAFIQLAQCHRQAGDWAAAARAFWGACQVAPAEAATWRNLALALHYAGDTPSAVDAALRALALAPADAEVAQAAALLLSRAARFRDADTICRMALGTHPRDAALRYLAAELALWQGHFAAGWALHEARLDLPAMQSRPAPGSPRWRGEPLEGRTLLVRGEQGLGDQVQFVRFAAGLRTRGAGRVVVTCHPALQRLLASAPGVDAVHDDRGPVPVHDVHIDMMSLPHVLEAADAVGGHLVPYLSVPAPPVRPPRRRPRIGVVWAGSPEQVHNRTRSLPPALVPQLLARTDVEWCVLQQGAGRAALDRVPDARRSTLIDVGAGGGDMADTAAALLHCDLVISVCTSVAHVAGALGCPTWVLLAHVADWRWLLDRDDSPFYPTVRLFRQPAPGAWEAVLTQVYAALDTWMPHRATGAAGPGAAS